MPENLVGPCHAKREAEISAKSAGRERAPAEAGAAAEEGAPHAGLALLNALDAIVWEADPRTLDFTWVSSGAERIVGIPPREWVGVPSFWRDHIHPDDREAAVAFCAAATERGENHEFEYRMMTPDGRAVWVRDLVRVVPGPDGRAETLYGVMFDITRLKELQSDLVASEDRMAQFIAASTEGILIHEGGRIVDMNLPGAAMLGYTPEELFGRMGTEIVTPQERERLMQYIAGGSTARLEGELLRKDGSTFPGEVRGGNITIGDRQLRIAVFHDLSERRDAERRLRDAREQLAHSQKLDAIGRLAGGVAHDFNNILTIIGASAENSLASHAPDDPRRLDLAEIKDAVARAGRLTRELLAFSRRERPKHEVLDLNSIVRGLSNILGRILGGNVSVGIRLAQAPARILGDRSRLEQVVLNLVVNARDAMVDGGTLGIVIEIETVDEGQARRILDAGAEPGRYVRLDVSDSGVGMSEDVRAHIFEPFFTTKAEGEGTGLGLATVYGVVKDSNGYVVVRSVPGEGTVFSCYFPEAGSGHATPPA